MNTNSIQLSLAFVLPNNVFPERYYSERELIVLFYKTAHHMTDDGELNSWIRATQSQIKKVKDLLYHRDQVCSTFRETIVVMLGKYVRTIDRFEQQFLKSCPCAVTDAGVLLKRLQEISHLAKVAQLYVQV